MVKDQHTIYLIDTTLINVTNVTVQIVVIRKETKMENNNDIVYIQYKLKEWINDACEYLNEVNENRNDTDINRIKCEMQALLDMLEFKYPYSKGVKI